MADNEGRRLRRGRREVAPRRADLGLSCRFRRRAGRRGKGPETAGPVEGPIGDHRLRHRDETTLRCSAVQVGVWFEECGSGEVEDEEEEEGAEPNKE